MELVLFLSVITGLSLIASAVLLYLLIGYWREK